MTTRHHRAPIRLSKLHERWVYVIGGVLFFSGLGWLFFHYFMAVPNEFGDVHNAYEPWWLKLHGAAAMGFLMIIGSLLPVHVTRAWRLRKNRSSGLFMVVLLSVLVATGYGLYYLGDEQTRPWISVIHWVIGVLVSAALPLHVWLGTRNR